MDFPLLSRTEADAVLESEYYAQEAKSEYLAETGSSFFYGGMSSSDATFLASQWLAERDEDFRQSEEGEIYYAKLEAAKLYDGVRALLLRDRDVPEFIDGKIRYVDPLFGPVSTTIEDIPF